eukprot:scaffold1034_cov175-Ochromonas_danica.AAC.2
MASRRIRTGYVQKRDLEKVPPYHDGIGRREYHHHFLLLMPLFSPFSLPGSDKYTVDDALSVSSLAVNIFKRKVIATDLSPDLREEDWKIVCEESAITTNTTTTPSLTDCLAIWHFLEME